MRHICTGGCTCERNRICFIATFVCSVLPTLLSPQNFCYLSQNWWWHIFIPPTIFLAFTLNNIEGSYIIRKIMHVNCRKFGKCRKVQKWKRKKYIYTIYAPTIAIPRDTISNIWCMYVFPLNKCVIQIEIMLNIVLVACVFHLEIHHYHFLCHYIVFETCP